MPPLADSSLGLRPERRLPPRRSNEINEINALLERLLAAQKTIGAILDRIDVQKDKHPLAGEQPTPDTKAEMRAILQRLMELQNKIQELEAKLTEAEQEAQKEAEMPSEDLRRPASGLGEGFDDLSPFPMPRERKAPFRIRPDYEDDGLLDLPPRPRRDIPPRIRRDAAPVLSPVPETGTPVVEIPIIEEKPIVETVAAPTPLPAPIAEPALVSTPEQEAVAAPGLSPEDRITALKELAKYEADYHAYKAQWDKAFADAKQGEVQRALHPEVTKYLADMEAYLAEQKKRLGV